VLGEAPSIAQHDERIRRVQNILGDHGYSRRAIENQAYIVAPDQVGHNPKSFATYGNSMIVDPWGRILARAPDMAAIIYAEIDLAYLQKIRQELPALTHRKLP